MNVPKKPTVQWPYVFESIDSSLLKVDYEVLRIAIRSTTSCYSGMSSFLGAKHKCKGVSAHRETDKLYQLTPWIVYSCPKREGTVLNVPSAIEEFDSIFLFSSVANINTRSNPGPESYIKNLFPSKVCRSSFIFRSQREVGLTGAGRTRWQFFLRLFYEGRSVLAVAVISPEVSAMIR